VKENSQSQTDLAKKSAEKAKHQGGSHLDDSAREVGKPGKLKTNPTWRTTSKKAARVNLLLKGGAQKNRGGGKGLKGRHNFEVKCCRAVAKNPPAKGS